MMGLTQHTTNEYNPCYYHQVMRTSLIAPAELTHFNNP